MKSNADMARELAPLLGKDKARNVAVFLNQILKGNRPLPKNWEPHLMTVTGLFTRPELLTTYPKMRFHDDRPQSCAYGSRLHDVTVIITSSGTAPANRIPEILSALAILAEYGIRAELRTIRKE